LTALFAPPAAERYVGSVSVFASGQANAIQAVDLYGYGDNSLVAHFYSAILRRSADSGGKTFWEGEVARLTSLGADINETWYAMAMSFYHSAEYVAFGRNPTQYVTDLYNTFFNRTPDPGGLSYWSGQLSQGMPTEVVLASFMFSTEFRDFTRGIYGSSAIRPEVDTVVDFFRGMLARLPDSGGFGYWLQRFRAAQCKGAPAVLSEVDAISQAFLASSEYVGRSRTPSEFVGDMYNAFLRRGGDLDGVRFWVQEVAGGGRTRDQVRRDFLASPEFSARVNRILQAGCLQ
jgi:hypothetical protein